MKALAKSLMRSLISAYNEKSWDETMLKTQPTVKYMFGRRRNQMYEQHYPIYMMYQLSAGDDDLNHGN